MTDENDLAAWAQGGEPGFPVTPDPAAPVQTPDIDLGEMALLAEDRAAIATLTEERDRLRALLQAWEPRVICPQCGERYHERACGPTHAVVYALVNPL